MQVHRQHAVDPGFLQQVGHQLGGDRLTACCFAISAGVAVVRDHSGDLPCRGSAAGIHHDQQLHQVVIDRSAGGLHQEHIAAADGFLDLDIELAISKSLADPGTDGNAEITSDFLSQSGVGIAAKQTKS